MLHKRIQERRKQLGLTQKQVGEFLHVGDKTISKYERGVNIPDAQDLNQLSIILKCSTDYLLAKTNDPDNKVYQSGDTIIEISRNYPHDLTPDEIETMLEYLKSTNYNVDKLINDLKNGNIK